MPHPLILVPPLGGSPGVRIWNCRREMVQIHCAGVRNFSSTCQSTPRTSGMQDQVVHCIERTLDVGNSTFI
jgi:hypothetical protein